jgi:ketosteroid isomerase-like protein
MNKTFSPLLALALCLSTGQARSDPVPLESLSWLSGCWERVDGEAGSGEYWTPLAGESLFGISRTVRGGKTVAYEFMQIRRTEDGAIELIAHPSGQATATFRLIEAPEHKAVFEDPAHDFPQRVIYQLQDPDHLAAWIEGTVSGEFQRVDFPLVRARSAALCPGHRPSTGSTADQASMREIAEAWVERYNAGDAKGVADLYAEDGYYASAHILARGRGQIEQYWAQGIAAGGHLDFVQPIEVHADGDLGYFLGKYQATNAGVTVDGRIVIVGKREAGQWKIAVHETVVRDQPE